MSQYPINFPLANVHNAHFQNKNLVRSSYVPSNSFNSSFSSSQQSLFLNRNSRDHNMSSNSIGKNQYHDQHCGKLKRQNSLTTTIELKQNDPLSRNCNNLNFLNSGSNAKKPQFQHNNQLNGNFQNSYYNPLISKRQKKTRQVEVINEKSQYYFMSRNQEESNLPQKLQSITRQFVSNSANISAQELSFLKKRVSQLEKKVDSNSLFISETFSKIKQGSKDSSPQKKQANNQKHIRSFSNATNSSKNYRQLTEIMTLIEQTKDYQRRNSQQYRKMIEEFRNTILQFRDQLNKNVKRRDYQVQISNVKNIIQKLRSTNNSTNIDNFANNLKQYENQIKDRLKSQKLQVQKQFEGKLSEIRLELNKLQQCNVSLKADLVKINFRQKMAAQQNEAKTNIAAKNVVQMQQTLNKLLSQRSQILKTGQKYEGRVFSFSIGQTLVNEIQIFQDNISANLNSRVLRNNQNVVNSVNQGDRYKQSGRVPIFLSKKTYYIDTQGYLLDANSRYLLNEKEQTIKISNKQLSLLRKCGVLCQ